MTIFLTIVHILVCVFLVIVVLLQSGKAADLAGAFGGMGSQTAFGPRGAATVLSKATTVAAALFMVTSLSLAILATRGAGRSSSVLERTQKAAPVQKGAPAGTPAPAAMPAAPGTIPGTAGAPAQAAPGDGIKPGQPYVELTPENGGPTRRVPIDVNKLPKVDPNSPAPKK
jgi:preprotein translocase subunit SecG